MESSDLFLHWIQLETGCLDLFSFRTEALPSFYVKQQF